MTKKRAWQAILDAVRETEPHKTEVKAHAAEAAILNRLSDTWPSPDFAEEQELFQAFDTIRLLRVLTASPELLNPKKQTESKQVSHTKKYNVSTLIHYYHLLVQRFRNAWKIS